LSLVALICMPLGCKTRESDSDLQGTTKTTVHPGIEYILESTDTSKVHIAKIDLTNPANQVWATKSEDRKSTVSKFAKKYRCKVAVNADFFNYSGYSTIGLAMGAGKVWPGSADNGFEGFYAFGRNN